MFTSEKVTEELSKLINELFVEIVFSIVKFKI